MFVVRPVINEGPARARSTNSRLKLFAASKMALIPGSYARAAGLQSEINKVTITRVANSEVQYRRTIDTYQRDLRFNVNQIGREQKQLRASMRRYYRKLRDSRHERKQREVREREAEERQHMHAQEFREAKKAVQRNVLTLNQDPKAPPVVLLVGDDGQEGEVVRDGEQPEISLHPVHVDHTAEGEHLPLPRLVPGSPDSGLGGELDDSQHGDSVHGKRGKSHPVDKTKPAYFKRSRRRDKTDKHEHHHDRHHHDRRHHHQHHQHHHTDDDDDDDDDVLSVYEDDDDVHLPVICEEGEGGGSRGGSALHSSTHDFKVSLLEQSLLASSVDDIAEEEHKENKRKLAGSTVKAKVTANGLNTKSFATLETPEDSDHKHERSGDHAHNGGEDACSNMDDSKSEASVKKARSEAEAMKMEEEMKEVDMMLAKKMAHRKPRKAGISYGDLIKLRHGTNKSTKKLFSLVDQLASKHGIADPPPITSSDLDPRTNDKIKQRGDESQSSSIMVRQSAILYYMKYGARSDDLDLDPDDDASSSSVLDGSVTTARSEVEGERGGEGEEQVVILPGGNQVVIRRRADGQMERSTQKLTLVPSLRDSSDPSSAYLHRASLADGFEDVLEDALGAEQGRSRSRGRGRGRATMQQLSDQASRIRERTLLGNVEPHGAQHANHVASLTAPRSTASPATTMTSDVRSRRQGRELSPISPTTASSRRTRTRSLPRESVDSQLQKRLKDPRKSEPAGNWMNALARLKMVHTLCDLSQHFD